MLDPYQLKGDRPELVDSVVLFLDILGSEYLANDEKAQDHLQRIFVAINAAEKWVSREAGHGLYRVLTFTDNLVLGWPLKGTTEDEGPLGSVFTQASYYQYEMVRRGLFVRGGLTCGALFMGESFAFGRGLIEAYDIERNTAVYPRVVLSGKAAALALRHTKFYSDVRMSPQSAQILYSPDGKPFLNYLDVLTEPDTDAATALEEHRDVIKKALLDSVGNPRVWVKYRWLADYHNYFCTRMMPGLPELRTQASAPELNFLTIEQLSILSDAYTQTERPA